MSHGSSGLAEKIRRAQMGQAEARDEILQQYRPFVMEVASACCRRGLQWENDDELSVAMLALNEAIDSYRPEALTGFLGFARAVIRRRLIDYFRRERRHIVDQVPLELGTGRPDMERIHNSVSWRNYERQREREERLDDMALFGKRLARFGITLAQVAQASPVHADTRQRLKQAAGELAEDSVLMEGLHATGRLPQKELHQRTGLSARVLTRGRPYIVALALVISSQDLPYLRDYFRDGGTGL